MTLDSPKANAATTIAAFPRSLSSMAISLGGLAIFLVLASLLLVSSPIGSTVHEYFYGVDSSSKLDTVIIQQNQRPLDGLRDSGIDVVGKVDKSGSDFSVPFSSSDVNSVNNNNNNSLPSETDGQVVSSDSESEVGALSSHIVASKSVENGEDKDKGTDEDSGNKDKGRDESSTVSEPETGAASENSGNEDKESNENSGNKDKARDDESSTAFEPEMGAASNFTDAFKSVENGGSENSINEDKESDKNSGNKDRKRDESSKDSSSKADLGISNMVDNEIKSGAEEKSGCDLYHGSWFYDPLGPSYTNNTCPVLTQMQNCQGNGRPDKDYENWRWKPSQCDLPRFDAKKFLKLMRGKTIAFIGDSVARNQMESMLCLLWQVEVPKNRGNKRMQRFYFRSTSTMVVRIWSSWLVRKTSEALDFAPEGIVKLHLDAPDDDFMEYIPNFDVVVLSSGHWFAKQSVYVLNNEIVGGQLWWPDKSRPMKVNNIEAFGISVETILTSIGTHPNFTGLAIVRSYSPDHYEGGAWNTGGSCTGKVKPLEPGKLVANAFTDIMHQKQVTGFERAIKNENKNKNKSNKSKMILMDITEAFSYRHDGHPGPYRSPDPNKITKRGPDGKPPPQDCLHWCMPGPVDTWNELVLEIIRREYEGSQSLS